MPDFLVPNAGKRKGGAKGSKRKGGGGASGTNANGGTTTGKVSSPKAKGKNGKSDSSVEAGSVAGTSAGGGGSLKYSPLKSKGNKDITTPYALHHDQIVTALIDDALRNKKCDNGGGTNNSNISNGVDVQQQQQQQQQQQHSLLPSSPGLQFKSDSSNHNNTHSPTKIRTSPHRIKRNGISGSPGMHLLRKRQRSNSEDAKLCTTTTTTTSLPLPPPLPATTLSPNALNNNNNIIDPSEFLHPDCILQKKKGPEKSQQLKPSKLSFTLSGSSTTIGGGGGGGTSSSSNATNTNDYTTTTTPSAIGREQTLLKLQQKLSMLSDIESGKYGMAVEMLRSDAVAFIVQHSTEDPPPGGEGRSSGGGGGQKKRTSSSSSVTFHPSPSIATKVETRSILTLRMGFVSMSYGILLQWDCGTRLVELIVLRKMCRDDFLTGSKNDEDDNNNYASSSMMMMRGGESNVVGDAHQQHQPSLPELIPAPMLLDSSSTTISPEKIRIHESTTTASSVNHHERGALPRLIHPPNPLAFLPRFLGSSSSGGGGGGGGITSATATSSTTTTPQYVLSVSALSVTQLHSVCGNCRDSNTFLGKIMANSSTAANSSTNVIRPYIRFVLGEYEHCTKVTKFHHTNGNATWTKRHHNSCLLPCRPDEEYRWFAGREDLTVEVRNEWKEPSKSNKKNGTCEDVDPPSNAPLWPTRLLFGAPNDDTNDASILSNHPVLAAVTVPLSSVNIEDDDSIGLLGRGTWRRRGGGSKSKDGGKAPSSTKITIPLRMNCCQSAPMGSISLRITIKATTPGGGSGGGSCADGGGMNHSSNNLYALAKPNIHVDISVSGDGGNGEPKVSESIELGPLTRLMDGWSLGGGGGGVMREEEPKERKKKGRSVQRLENKSSFSWPEIMSSSPLANNNEEGEKKRTSIMWSKRLDHQTKKWSALKLNRTESSTTPTDDVQDSGWFALLRGRSEEAVEGRKTM